MAEAHSEAGDLDGARASFCAVDEKYAATQGPESIRALQSAARLAEVGGCPSESLAEG